eukprot:TRINITY_DN2355_c0_g1_i1.p1 TRINITY_DN2355_c0_g1~~TRINITY_DN2355_c0_g1_i1.p1  ORF type:complete len:503 (+),score=103.24 TRINITY_DN2355_c0_g1_i1:421-1929(+)
MMVPHETEVNKGFAFVRMTTRSAALDCVTKLDKYEIRPGKELGVCISESNCRLFLAGIPKDKTREEILEEFSNACNGVLDIVFYADPKDLNRNRGFCFVDFDSHGNAANCRKRVLSSRLTVWNKSNLVCDWAIPQEEPGSDVMSKVKTLFVKHIADNVTQHRLEELFTKYGPVEKINRIKDYAFIFFETREGAMTAQEATNEMDLMGSHISVSLAKPAAKNRDVPAKGGYKTEFGNDGYRGPPLRRGRGPRGHRGGGHWGGPHDPGFYEPWAYGPPPPPPMGHFDYGPPGDDYYHGAPPMVSYPTPHSSMPPRGRGGPKRAGQGGNRRGGRGGGAKFESGPKPPPGPRNGGGRGRGTRGHSRGGGGPLGMKPQSTPGGQPEYKPEWSATDYSAPGYAAYPAYNQSGSWSEDYTSDTWQQPGGKRPASNVTTPDPKRAHYQPTTPAAQWTGQYQTSTAYPVTPQSSQWSSQTWTGTQQPQGQAVPQGQQPQQQAAWGYQGWTQ